MKSKILVVGLLWIVIILTACNLGWGEAELTPSVMVTYGLMPTEVGPPGSEMPTAEQLPGSPARTRTLQPPVLATADVVRDKTPVLTETPIILEIPGQAEVGESGEVNRPLLEWTPLANFGEGTGSLEGTQPGASQNPAALPANLSPALQLFPELRTAVAPDWVQEGLRVTYWIQSSTKDEVAQTSSSGAGYLQYDLVAMDGQNVVSQGKFYAQDATGQAVVPSSALPSLGLPGAGDYWISPTALVNAERVAQEQLQVVRMPTTLNSKQYQVVRFQYEPEGARYVWMYEEASGLLLYYSQDIGSEGAAKRNLAQQSIANVRHLTLPWQTSTAPAWVQPGAKLLLRGSYKVENLGGILPMAVEMRFIEAHPTWSVYEMTTQSSGLPGLPEKRVSGVYHLFGGAWLPAEAFGALHDGQKLDYDPVTGATVTASFDSQGFLTLTESGALFQSSLIYDPTDGALTGLYQRVVNGLVTTLIELQRINP